MTNKAFEQRLNRYCEKIQKNNWPFKPWDLNKVAFKYLDLRIKYLKQEQHFNFMDYMRNKKQRDQYLFFDWKINQEIKKTLNKWVDVEKDLFVKLGIMEE